VNVIVAVTVDGIVPVTGVDVEVDTSGSNVFNALGGVASNNAIDRLHPWKIRNTMGHKKRIGSLLRLVGVAKFLIIGVLHPSFDFAQDRPHRPVRVVAVLHITHGFG
jgi:hypothetical protein